MPVYDIYVENGLTAVSNINSIIPRDASGNVLIDLNTSQSSSLIVETITQRYTKRSVVNAIPTAFSYFTFPVTENVPPTELNIDTDFSDILPTLPDPIFARYRPSTNYTIPDNITGTLTGLEFSTIDSGLQPRSNLYLITKQIKELNRPLRFRLQVTVTNTRPLGALIPDTSIRFAFGKNDTTTNGVLRNFKPGGDIYFPSTIDRLIPVGQTISFSEDIVISADEFIRGTVFGVTAWASRPGVQIDANTSSWVISDATQDVDEFGDPN
jgi:hypothetical protein